MVSVNLSPANQAYAQQKQQETTSQIQAEPKVEQKKNGKKLLIAGAIGVATVAVAGIMIHNGKKAKAEQLAQQGAEAIQEAAQEIQENASKKIADIKFNKGIASDKDGNLFTGIIEDTLKNGKKVKMEYADGKIVKSEIDNKIFKEYRSMASLYDDNMIEEHISIRGDFDDTKRPFHFVIHKDKGGNISKIDRYTANEFTTSEFEDKKIHIKFFKDSLNKENNKIELFDKDGNVIKKLKKAKFSFHGKNFFEEVEDLPDGGKKVKSYWIHPGSTDSGWHKFEIGEPMYVEWYDNEKKYPIKTLEARDNSKINWEGKGQTNWQYSYSDGNMKVLCSADPSDPKYAPRFFYRENGVPVMLNSQTCSDKEEIIIKENMPKLFEALKQEGITIHESVLKAFEKL